jgi:hypothetical protein
MPFCSKCGKEVTQGTRFCPYCGYDQTGTSKLEPADFTSEEMEEAKKIESYIEPDERVLLVARQSRIMPGGSITTPNIIFATNKKLVIRNPMVLGMRETVQVVPYTEITSVNLEKGLFSSEVTITAPGLTTELGRLFKLSRHGIAGIPAIPKEKAVRLVEIVKEGIKQVKSSAERPSVTMASTPVDELKKLKELLDMGAITQQEYEDKKKRLLERI